MPPTLAISGHGTLISVQLTPGGAFTDIAEQGDITPPEVSRNEFDSTTQEKDIDAYVLGVLRRGSFTQPLNFLPDHNTHDHLTGVFKLIIDNTVTGWKITYPDTTMWIMSGQVQALKPNAPVDGKLSLDMTLRFSGGMQIGKPGALVDIGLAA
jgi:hypothetical protein